MIGLDTNILVRVLFKDPVELGQSEMARTLVRKAIAEGQEIHINTATLVETVWVFESAYKARKPRLVKILEEIHGCPHFTVEAPLQLEKAIAAYKTGKGDFSDHLIGWMNAAAGCKTTYTFDRALRGSKHFTLLNRERP